MSLPHFRKYKLTFPGAKPSYRLLFKFFTCNKFKIARHNELSLSLASCPSLCSLWNIWDWNQRVYKFNFYLYIPLKNMSNFSEHSPFFNFNDQFVALDTCKHNFHWFPRILCHYRCTRRFSMDCIMISYLELNDAQRKIREVIR